MDKMMDKIAHEAAKVHKQMPKNALWFTATVEDPIGWDAIPSALLIRLNTQYFPDCIVAVSRPDTGDKAFLGSIMSLMLLVVQYGTTVKFQCDTDPKTFEALRRCICLVFRRSDNPAYGETYNECSNLLQSCKDKGYECLLHELSNATQLEGRSPILRNIPDSKRGG
jgi:phosphotransferase system HPr-like phosphotransfer protein